MLIQEPPDSAAHDAGDTPVRMWPSIAGPWVLSIARDNSVDVRRFLLAANGSRVTARLDGRTLTGTITDERVDLSSSDADVATVAFEGRRVGNGLAGQYRCDGLRWAWSAVRPSAPQVRALRRHAYEPTEFPRVFSGAVAPVLRIEPGDTVATWCVDSSGFDAHGVQRCRGGDPETGPFYVDGALPGDTLAVTLTKIRPNRDTAVAGDRFAVSTITPAYVQTKRPERGRRVAWTLERNAGVARLSEPSPALENFTVPLCPMLGCIAVAPPTGTTVTTHHLGSFGGNLDYNRVREGATVYLPVSQPGALLFLGDGHAAQGDAEPLGSALETSMDIEFTVNVIPAAPLTMPRVEDDMCLMAMGIAGSLTDAFQLATTHLTEWLEQDYGLSVVEVASVLGPTVEYRHRGNC